MSNKMKRCRGLPVAVASGKFAIQRILKSEKKSIDI